MVSLIGSRIELLSTEDLEDVLATRPSEWEELIVYRWFWLVILDMFFIAPEDTARKVATDPAFIWSSQEPLWLSLGRVQRAARDELLRRRETS